ncbi:MAG: nitrogenase stabilizing/protective protein NifW [Roseiarcus sp.]
MQCSLEKPVDTKDIVARLKTLSSAEDFFDALRVPYDETVLRVARLHILKRMGEHLASDDLDGLPDTVAGARAQAMLRRAYEEFEAQSPLKARVFQVLKDHDPNRPVAAKTAFVSLDDILPLDETPR